MGHKTFPGQKVGEQSVILIIGKEENRVYF